MRPFFAKSLRDRCRQLDACEHIIEMSSTSEHTHTCVDSDIKSKKMFTPVQTFRRRDGVSLVDLFLYFHQNLFKFYIFQNYIYLKDDV